MDLPHEMCVVLAIVSSLLVLRIVRQLVKSYKNKTAGSRIPELPGAWPLVGHLHLLLGPGPAFRKLGAMADVLGPVFSLRLGVHHVVVLSSREAARECLAANDRALASRPDIAAGRHMGYNSAVLGLAPYGPYLRLIRKIATLELFSGKRLEALRPVRSSEVDALTKELWHQPAGGGVAMGEKLEHMTFNMNLRMITGNRYKDEEFEEVGSDAWRFKRAIDKALYLCGVFVLSDAIPWLGWLDFQGHVRSMKETGRELDSLLEKWLRQHLEKRSNKGIRVDGGGADFMDIMLESLPEDDVVFGHKRKDIIKATALILILTGTESTSITMTWALSLLLNHPAALKSAQHELDTVVGRHEWVQESDISSLKYLQAVVKETLRLYPPAPLTGIREAMEDCRISGCHVPKGTRVLVNIWKLQRDPRVWPEPDAFRPERFLEERKEVDLRAQNFEFIPFSSGRRSCPGATLGLQVVQFTLARILQGFEVTLEEGSRVDMEEGPGIALPKVNPLRVALKPRLPLHLYESL
ncbi:dimethylnonatriene synthase-like [Rhodamnia argentea]|uniref:Dimethylnonatriene synthase-like n=1 Tax=Rhodamnia argentea TaxID=178133 RepID=A0A8B8PD30_9MYRT|nr:dimethylnonatriene synthase-like [Rhodamnia argentea]XP_030532701.2 dimethylnonatriene synthase-like [Rhodamnia argentea]